MISCALQIFRIQSCSSCRIFSLTFNLLLQDGKATGVSVFGREITEQKLSEKRIETQFNRLAALRAIDTAITGTHDLHHVLNIILEQARSQLNADTVRILLLNRSTQELRHEAGYGFAAGLARQREKRLVDRLTDSDLPQPRPVHRSLRTGVPDQSLSALMTEEGFEEYYGVPMIAKGTTVGVLEIFQRTAFEADSEWRNFLETLAGQTAIAVDHSRLFHDLQHANRELILAYDETIAGWPRALDLRDRETEGHSLRVTELTERMGQAMGISGEGLVNIRRGALLHDIGKMGVPDNILPKQDGLTEEEWTVMRRHPQIAFDLLAPIAFLRPALDIPGCHHEKWDGSGYPRGLKGEQIPLAARLFAVTDVWDALRSDRPYRKAWPEEKVLEYIRSLSGTHFDPKTVEVFLQIINEGT